LVAGFVGIAAAPPLAALEAIALPPVDALRVSKSERRLDLLSQGRVIQSFPIALGFNPTGRKIMEGDGRTPEGSYLIDARNPASHFHRALRISYPAVEDLARAAALGLDPGGEIMIHGLPNGRTRFGADHVVSDWTDGCIALTNEQMDLVWHSVALGTPIEIAP
jgi:murein L,D-transpeptidase YafK